jgi:hypothetical protein
MTAKGSTPHILWVDGREVPLALRRSGRARRITLSVDEASGEVRLVLPRRAALAEGLDFARDKAAWIGRRLADLPPRVAFAEGAVVPYLGEAHVIGRAPRARRGVWREAGMIRVSGYAEHLPRRVADFLKGEARREVAARAKAKAARLGRPLPRITLRDTRSRWGSCSAAGGLNFSWRLIMAPEAVLDYVVAHEVAHLVHMDHGPRFWALVAELTPSVAGPRRWLRQEGNGLLRYG